MPGKIEEAEHVLVADVEEEMAGARIVPVFHQFDQREAQELLVELNGLLDITADQRDMVDAADGSGEPLTRRAQDIAGAIPPGGSGPCRVPLPGAVA